MAATSAATVSAADELEFFLRLADRIEGLQQILPAWLSGGRELPELAQYRQAVLQLRESVEGRIRELEDLLDLQESRDAVEEASRTAWVPWKKGG